MPRFTFGDVRELSHQHYTAVCTVSPHNDASKQCRRISYTVVRPYCCKTSVVMSVVKLKSTRTADIDYCVQLYGTWHGSCNATCTWIVVVWSNREQVSSKLLVQCTQLTGHSSQLIQHMANGMSIVNANATE